MHCPECRSEGADIVRGGAFPSRELRELVAPQKYRCTRCEFRWLAWPWLYTGNGALPRALRRMRRLIGGRGEWAPPEQGGKEGPGPITWDGERDG